MLPVFRELALETSHPAAPLPPMTPTLCSLDDFNQIFADIADFWGHDRTLYLHHPMYVREFGNTAYVIKDGDTVAAYLFSFLSQTRPGRPRVLLRAPI